MRPRHLLGAAFAATLAAALWWRKNPSACPYGQRFWVEAPHPIITRDRLRSVLRPQPGERLLELGVGTGYYSCELAEWVAPDGTSELFDLQQKFLDHTLGEIPDAPAALREIRRVLKPDGRLVVGELFGDPHFTTRKSLQRMGADAGLELVGTSGNWFGYFARLELN